MILILICCSLFLLGICFLILLFLKFFRKESNETTNSTEMLLKEMSYKNSIETLKIKIYPAEKNEYSPSTKQLNQENRRRKMAVINNRIVALAQDNNNLLNIMKVVSKLKHLAPGKPGFH